MIQLKTLLNCIDNSGASVVECVANLRMKRHAKIGDRIIVVIQKQKSLQSDSPSRQQQGGGGGASSSSSSSAAQTAGKVRRGDIRHAVVVRTRKSLQRPNGQAVSFGDNACVLINKAGEPIGTRVNGIVGRELREKGWSKILSLAASYV